MAGRESAIGGVKRRMPRLARGGERRAADRAFLVGVARAFGGAIFFSLPLLMTMEMWWLGFYLPPLRLVAFLLLMLPVLAVLNHYAGFRDTWTWGEEVVDAFVAYAVGFVAAATVLALFGVVAPGMPLREVVGKVALQAIPASFGAVLAISQLGPDGAEHRRERERQERAGHAAELFFMAAGALFLAFNVAPTEEMILIAYQMTPWHALALVAATLAMMHAFVYAVEFRGGERHAGGRRGESPFLRYTVPGYALSLLVAAYVLWTFGRFDDGAHLTHLMHAVVLGFPAALGAAAARLIL
jgi:putative integral membrane protein (TIGR02587 family)